MTCRLTTSLVLGAVCVVSACNCGAQRTGESYTLGGTVTGLQGTGLVLQDLGANNLAITGDGPFTFPNKLSDGAKYVVTVLTQPSSGQLCSVAPSGGLVSGANVTTIGVICSADVFPVGGTVSGLIGSGLVLQDNGGDDLLISVNGAFSFATALAGGAAYSVTVRTQPQTPSQICTVTNGSGTVSPVGATAVTVTCVTDTFTIGGSVAGLEGMGLVLQDNGGDSLSVTFGSSFTFPTAIETGGAFEVTVAAQPANPAQTCVVSGGAGVVGTGNVTSVAVTCTTSAFSVGGSVSGLAGMGLVLEDNGGDDLSINSDGVFTFAMPIVSGGTFSVSVLTQPTTPDQTCFVSNGLGEVGANDINSVTVSCRTYAYPVSGAISGLIGSGLGLQDNGGDDLMVASNTTTFTFPTLLNVGSSYVVTVAEQPTSPSQMCTVSLNGSGAVGDGAVNDVVVACSTNQYPISVDVIGLAGSGLILEDNAEDKIAAFATGTTTFAQLIPSGGAYSVTVLSQPTDPSQACAVAAPSGRVTNAGVTVTATCVTSGPTDAGPIDAGPIDAGPIDAGPIDAGPIDAGPIDAGPIDAGPVDAGPIDAGPIDAGPVDAGPIDAGPVDAGPVDAGPVDAGPIDAGPIDAGPIDAGPVDAGPVDAGPIDAGPIDAGPVDAGPIDAGPVDAGPVDAGRIDAGSAVGCSDGTREGFTSLTQFPNIAGCSGGWSIPGVMAQDPGIAPACPGLATFNTVTPACGRIAGNSSSNPTGMGCNVADLCAPGWHVCTTANDVKESSPSGCQGATDGEGDTQPGDVDAGDEDGGDDAGASAVFFITRQSSDGCNDCALGTTTGSSCNSVACESGCLQNEDVSNDVYGCGTLGYALSSCGVLNRASENLCASLGGSWSCSDETFDGSGVCEAYTVVHSNSVGGGVLCCADISSEP